ncbi:MAG: orotate phosphoribosyltransferase [Pseudomonadota bacterium]
MSGPGDSLGGITAQILLDTGCLLFRPDRPFVFSSGWASPVFVDCKRLISMPVARDALLDLAMRRILATAGYATFDTVAGGEVAGIPFAAMVADRLHLPLVLVRKEGKGLGPAAQTEGVLKPGATVLLVGDVTTDGRTKAVFCKGLRRAGALVDDVFVIFKYGIFDRVVRDLDAMGIRLFALADWTDILDVARQRNALTADILAELEVYIADPIGWSAAHGGAHEARA